MHNILLGVTGGIAAYKSCELVRELQRRGLKVTVIMTESAQKFVGPLSFEALTQKPVYTDLFEGADRGIAHIELARAHDLMVIAPTSANTLAKMANGVANDLLTTVYLAFDGPVMVAPAMNTYMWENDSTQKNIGLLKSRNIDFIDPVGGELACGEVGLGKMAEPEAIAEAIGQKLELSKTLKGKHVVVTAGPTREYIDPVRFLSSPSSGRMGFELAREAAKRGAKVTLIHGPVSMKADFPAKIFSVESAEEMHQAVMSAGAFDVFIGAAAVADYTPAETFDKKMKKDNEPKSIELKRTVDIIAKVASDKKKGQVVVGFAAETNDLERAANTKRKNKNLDLIVANEVFKSQKGFVQDQTSVSLVDEQGTQKHSNISKSEVARLIVDRVELQLGCGSSKTSH